LPYYQYITTGTAEGDDILPYLRERCEPKNALADCARNPFVSRAVMRCYAMSRRVLSASQTGARPSTT